MDTTNRKDVLEITQEELEKLRECYNIYDDQPLEENVEAIKIWIRKEQHLFEASKYMNDKFIQRMYYLSKGSLEATKISIDKLLTSKYLLPELCCNRNMEEFNTFFNKIQILVPPKLNPMDLSRVSIMRFLTDELNDVPPLTVFRYIFMMEDYIQHHDLNSGMTIVVDLTNFPLGYFLSFSPVLFQKAITLYTKAYKSSIKGIHFLNAPFFIDQVMIFIKQVVTKKLKDRIYVNKTYENLHTYVAKDILPQEYGGHQYFSAAIAENWRNTFYTEEGWKTVAIAEKLVVDESKRCSSKFNEEYLGIPGSFREMRVD